MKRKDKSECPGLASHASDVGLKDMYPSLSEFMTAAAYEDGEGRRESPTVTLWCSGGEWKASVKDRAEGLVLWLSASSWSELLQMIDLFCLESTAPWRHDENGHERNGKRVRK